MRRRLKRNLVIGLLACGGLCVFLYGIPQGEAQKQAFQTIQLPPPDVKGGIPLMQALKKRESNRSFRSKELSLDVLSNLLWAAFGVNRPTEMRTAPSAHNAQEIDLYVVMKAGLYRYDAHKNVLVAVLPNDLRKLTGRQTFTQEAPVNLIYVANLAKIGEDEVAQNFYSAIDTGFISQNVYLFCASEGLSTVVLGWVDIPALSKAMGLQPAQRIIVTQPVGYPK